MSQSNSGYEDAMVVGSEYSIPSWCALTLHNIQASIISPASKHDRRGSYQTRDFLVSSQAQ